MMQVSMTPSSVCPRPLIQICSQYSIHSLVIIDHVYMLNVDVESTNGRQQAVEICSKEDERGDDDCSMDLLGWS